MKEHSEPSKEEPKHLPIKWRTLSNETDTRVLKQHAVMPRICKEKYTGDPYSGNISLCKRIAVSEDGERSMPWIRIDDVEVLNDSIACKTCLKIYNKLNSQQHERK